MAQQQQDSARVDLPTEETATGPIKDFFDDVIEYAGGYLPASARAHGAGEDLAEAYMGFTKRVRADSALPRELKEGIALVVSQANQSESCMSTHAGNLKDMGVPEDELQGILERHYAGETDERTAAVLDYARKITERSHEIEDADVDRLRDHGFTDDQITEMAILACYYNYINRINFALYDRD